MESKFQIIVAILVFGLYLSSGSDIEIDGDLREMVLRLNVRLNQLESQREIDGKQLQLLREKCDQSPEPVFDMSSFEKSLASLRTDVGALAANRERETGRLTDIRELRLEFDSLHSDYSKLKVEVDGLKDRREENVKIASQQRNSQVTIKWLQKTIEELRREITELASAYNVSASIRQQQKVDNSLKLLRSDVIDLRKKLEEVRVTQDKTAATLTVNQQDVLDLQNQKHQVAANFQLLREEVSQLKDEILNSSPTPSRSLKPRKVGASGGGWGSNDSAPEKEDSTREEETDVKATGVQKIDYNKKQNDLQFDHQVLINGETHHRLRHKGRALKEIEELRYVVSSLQAKQKRTEHKLNEFKRNHTAVESNLHHMWGRMADLLNATRWRVAQHSALERQIDDIKDDLKRMDHHGVETTKTLHNLTDTVAGIDKLHTSTIQLFEALEGLEDEYSERIGDLHKEVSKFEFNMAQLSSTVNILKEDQSTQYAALKSTRSDISGLRQQIEDQNYRLASLRSQVLHHEANSLLKHGSNEVPNSPLSHKNIRMGRDEDQTSLMLDLESRVAEFDARLLSQSKLINNTLDGMRSKADLEHVIHWAESADKLDEMIKNVSLEVSPLTDRVAHLEHQLQEIYQQFPTDCSHVIGEKTGLYQIHPQGAHEPLTVLCDINANDGSRWTVIQNRINSDADFNKNWAEYQNGFGKVSSVSDFWIGNEALHRLSRRGSTLRLDLWDQEGNYRYATYSNFRIEDESHSYRLHVSGFEGNVSDALNYHHGMKFSTRDKDQDRSDSVNCAEEYEGGWWYRNCQHANLNGKYSLGLTWFDQDNNTWLQLQRIQIKIKPKIA